MEKMRDEALNEFYKLSIIASNLNIFKVSGLLRKKKWNKIEIKKSMRAINFEKKYNITKWHCNSSIALGFTMKVE